MKFPGSQINEYYRIPLISIYMVSEKKIKVFFNYRVES